MDEELDYHRSRANRELNLGLASSAIRVARAHLQLSSLHFKKMREIELRSQHAAVRAEPPFVL
ncbi:MULTISPECIES: hypothetical protein [Sphingomonas]|uniref:hypothetical protein n=1 Tax=Sphingomonas TaxID=13687 RepID=UPI000DEEC3D1|nr:MULTISPECIES: hypothetical protein [Sphingomonas]